MKPTLRELMRVITWGVRDHYVDSQAKPLEPEVGISPDEAVDRLLDLIQERDTKLKEALLGALPEHDDIGNHDRETSSITPAQVEAFNQAIDQTITAINACFERDL